MTLDTRVFVLDQVDPHQVFHEFRHLIGATDEHTFTDDPNTSGSWTVMNDLGQGLPGWLMVNYRPNKPLRPEADEYVPACWLELSIDTSYGYQGPGGLGPGDLHASLLSAFGQWLEYRNIRWQWLNEFTGEFHDGYDGLDELGIGGREAGEWFLTTVLPALQARHDMERGL